MRRRGLSCFGLLIWLLPGLVAQTSLSPASKEVSAGRTVYRISVDAPDAWTANCSAAWVTLGRTAGRGGGWLELDVAPNRTDADRTATVTVGGAEHVLTQHSLASGDNSLYIAGFLLMPWLRHPGVVHPRVASFAAGGAQAFVILDDRSLWAAGWNREGELGDGTTTHREAWVRVASDVTAVDAAGNETLFLKSDGTVYGMGSNQYGQLCAGTQETCLEPVAIMSGVSRIAAGGTFSMFLQSDGTLRAVGNNSNGQLGDGTTLDRREPVTIDQDVVAIAATGVGYYLKSNGQLWRTGPSSVDGQTVYVPVLVDVDVSQLAGSHRILYIKHDGTLWTLGAFPSSWWTGWDLAQGAAPIHIADDVVAAACGYDHALFVRNDGSLWAVGTNSHGQLGDGTSVARYIPIQVTTDVTAVSAGSFFSLFRKTDGSLWGMGWNVWGQFGDGLPARTRVPTHVAAGVVKVSNGGHKLAFIDRHGTLWGLGYNDNGELGVADRSYQPEPVVIATNVASVDLGRSETNYVKTDGSLWRVRAQGWDVPELQVQVATGVKEVAAGGAFWLMIKTDGSLWTQGVNNLGQLGDGTETFHAEAVQIDTGVKAVDAGNEYSLYLKVDGTLWGMGNNAVGQLGDGTTTPRNRPVQIEANVTAMSVCAFGTVFLTTDGSLWLAGKTSPLAAVPAAADRRPYRLARDVTAFWAGEYGGIFYRGTDGIIYAIGSNSSWQLGDARLGEAATAAAPVASGVEFISAGDPMTCFIVAAGGGFHALRASPTITWPDLGTIAQGTVLGPGQLNASADAAGHFTFTPAAGTVLPIGTHTLAATFQPDDFLGVNPVTVERSLTVGPGYVSWRENHFDAAQREDTMTSGPLADPDDDGLSNLVEYALGGDPWQSANESPRMEIAGNDWIFTYTLVAGRTDVRCEPQVSSDLVTWSSPVEAPARISMSDGVEVWQARIPLNTETVFFRLVVTQP